MRVINGPSEPPPSTLPAPGGRSKGGWAGLGVIDEDPGRVHVSEVTTLDGGSDSIVPRVEFLLQKRGSSAAGL